MPEIRARLRVANQVIALRLEAGGIPTAAEVRAAAEWPAMPDDICNDIRAIVVRRGVKLIRALRKGDIP